MKNVVKIIFVILIMFIMFSTFQINKTYAIGEVITGADDFIKSGAKDKSPVIQEEDMKEMSDLLYNALLVIAIIIAVIVGLVIGIKMMTESAAEKAKVKETLIPYIAGCIVIFGAFAIWKLVVQILSQTQ